MKHEINWTHWFQMRVVRVWEACLLSVDVDPSGIPTEDERSFYKLSSFSPHIYDTTFGTPDNQAEYYRRLRLVSSFLEDTSAFTLISRADTNKHLWEISLSDFCALAQRVKLLPLPAEMNSVAVQVSPPIGFTTSPVVNNPDQTATASIQPTTNWKKIAEKIALKVQREKPKFSRDQISEAVNAEMKSMLLAGDQNVTGRGGKLPSAASILRHALTGLKVNNRLAGMTRQAQKVLGNS